MLVKVCIALCLNNYLFNNLAMCLTYLNYIKEEIEGDVGGGKERSGVERCKSKKGKKWMDSWNAGE